MTNDDSYAKWWIYLHSAYMRINEWSKVYMLESLTMQRWTEETRQPPTQISDLNVHSLSSWLVDLLADLFLAILLVGKGVGHAFDLWARRTHSTLLRSKKTSKRKVIGPYDATPCDKAWCPWRIHACRLSAGTSPPGETNLSHLNTI